jgi:hypothetical protein
LARPVRATDPACSLRRLDEDQDGLVADAPSGISRGPVSFPAAGWLVALVALGAYAWWGSAAAPFQPVAYAVVGLPGVGVLWVVLCRGEGRETALGEGVRTGGARARHGVASPARPARLVALLPLVGLAAIGLALEVLGLAHGGRAVAFPTLSDVVDEVIRFHGARAGLLALWLAGGVAIVRSRARRSQCRVPAGHPVQAARLVPAEGPVPPAHPLRGRHPTGVARATPARSPTRPAPGDLLASRDGGTRR